MSVPAYPIETALVLLVAFALGTLLGRALKWVASADGSPPQA